MEPWTPDFDLRQRRKWKRICRLADLQENLITATEKIGTEINAFAYSIIQPDVNEPIWETGAQIEAALRAGATYEQLALCLIRDFAGGRIETGWYHVAKGRLNTMGPPKDLLALFNGALKRLLESGFMPEEYVREAQLALQKAISEEG